MDLSLDIRTLPGRAAPVTVELVRDLRDADKALLAMQPTAVRNGTGLRRLRDSHHKVAKALADGCEPAEVSMLTGYSLSRVYVLGNDPAFKELVSFYRENKDKEYTDFHGRLASLATDATAELHARLDEEPDKMSNEFLADLVKTLADRTGHAPVSKSVNTNVNINLADRLARGRQRAAEFSGQAEDLVPLQIEGKPGG